jgi:outer membrane protein OmpA-like peptidoglycan-associated protein
VGTVGYARDAWGSLWPALQFSKPLGPVLVGLDLGARVRAAATLNDRVLTGNELTGGLGVGLKLGPVRPAITARVARTFETGELAAELGAEVRGFVGPVEFFGGATAGLGPIPGTPVLRVLGGVAVRLGSGSTTTQALATPPPPPPSLCGETSAHRPEDCPDLDDDRDGIINRIDRCPLEPEDIDSYQDQDGCPDRDNDADGIVDELDRCPLTAGVKAFGGCAPPDADKDGVPDAEDRCPADAGPARLAGCPERDDDGDGVLNQDDNCVKEAGPKSNNGCPQRDRQLVQITRDRLLILDRVYFTASRARVLPRSLPLLDQVAKVLLSHSEIAGVVVEGHTDDQGAAAANRKLSQDRANAVRAHLISKGVAPSRVTAVGYGPDRPIESNLTPAGREANRRVEFTILQSPPHAPEKTP